MDAVTCLGEYGKALSLVLAVLVVLALVLVAVVLILAVLGAAVLAVLALILILVLVAVLILVVHVLTSKTSFSAVSRSRGSMPEDGETIQDLSFGLKIREARNEPTTVAQIPPAVAFNPPVKMPRNP